MAVAGEVAGHERARAHAGRLVDCYAFANWNVPSPLPDHDVNFIQVRVQHGQVEEPFPKLPAVMAIGRIQRVNRERIRGRRNCRRPDWTGS